MAKILFYRSDWTANVTRQTEDAYGGVGYYRIVKVAEEARKAGHEVDIVGAKFTLKGETLEQRYTRIFSQYDVLWTCYSSHSDDASAMFYFRDKFKKKVILDLDDNYLDILDTHPLYDRLKASKKDRAFIGTILSFADALTISTEPLKQRMHEHFKTVYGIDKKMYIIPNFNEINDWKYTPVEKKGDKIIIGYSGSNSHQNDLKMIMPHLAKVMDKYKNVYFESIGAISQKEIGMFDMFSKDALDRCDLVPATATFNEYPKHLANQPWDITLAPLEDNAFTRCKSHIKWMEYAMFKMPTIASRVYPYYVDLMGRKIVEHGYSGLLVKPSEWTDAIESLILDKEKRIRLGENAYKSVSENWQYENSGIPKVINGMLKDLGV